MCMVLVYEQNLLYSIHWLSIKCIIVNIDTCVIVYIIGYMTEEPNMVFIFVLLSKNFILHVNVCLTQIQFFAKHAQVTVQNECSLNLKGKM